LRHAIERIAPPRYLNSTYYERWLDAAQILLMEKRVISRAELEARDAEPPVPSQPPVHFEGPPYKASQMRARFRVGDRVIASNLNRAGHTRLPRYARGKRGVIWRDWGVYAFPDSNAHGGGDRPQHVYSVEFEAHELWGASASSRDKVHLDLWEDYLEADRKAKGAATRGRSPSRSSRRSKR
jgi:nitrile hydratase subunit beta